jgi:hypothetical protein
MLRMIRSYIFWTYERGSVHYDVMVTLILLFIFVSPHVINFRDRPIERLLPPSQVLVNSDGQSELIYQIDAATLASLHKSGAANGNAETRGPASPADLTTDLRTVIVPISGEVTIERYQPVKSSSGKVIAYRVWAHR